MASELRLSGLVSGADTQAIIDVLMQAYRMPLAGMEDRKEKLGFEKEALRNVNLQLSSLRSSLDALKLESTFLLKSVSSGNSDVVTATADTTAQTGDILLSDITLATATRVTSLAVLNDNADTAAIMQSASEVVTGGGYINSGVLDTSRTFAIAGFDGQINNGTITINGEKFIIDADVTTVDEFMGEVNNSSAGVTIAYSAADDQFTLTSDDTGSAASISISESNTNFFTEANITIISTIYGDGTINPDRSLVEQTFSPTGLTSEDFQVSFKINDMPFTFNIFNNTLNEIIEEVNDSNAGIIMSYDSESDKVTITNSATGANEINLEDVKGNFLDITNLLDVTRGDISAVADGGNTSDATVSADLRSNTAPNETYTITFNAGGTDYDIVRLSDSATIASGITYVSGGANRWNVDGLSFTITDGASAPAAGDIYTVTTSNNPNPAPVASAYTAGTDAQLDWNGTTITPESNTFTRDGITVTLKEDYSAGNILLKVTNNTDTAKTAILEFVEKYNNLTTLLSPQPLTDEQKVYLQALDEEDELKMTFQEIDEHNSKYQLYHTMDAIRKDRSLSRMKSVIRRELFNPVSGLSTQYDRLNDIGLSTGKVGIALEEAKKGILQLDEDELIAALEADPYAVFKLFSNDADATSSNADQDGIARMLIDHINSAISYQGFIQQRIVIGGSIDRQINNVNSQIEKFEKRLYMVEERLILEFASMETILSNLNSQSSWLEGQINSL